MSDYYKIRTRRDGESGDDFFMYIDWSMDADRQVFELAKAIKNKKMRKIYFDGIKTEENKDILDYLINNCPEQLRIFTFNTRSNAGVFGSGDFYLKGILKVIEIF